MTVKLSLKEKCYLVALFGDIPLEKRKRMFSVSSLPAQAGPAVIAEGYRFLGYLNNGDLLVQNDRPSLFDS